MEQDLVSIIMLSHNNGKNVEESVKSIFAQTYKNWELLFVDDASRDDTMEKLLRLKENDNRFKISYTVFENGTAMHLNSALKGVRGRWVAFMLCGDIWEPNKLQDQVAFMVKNGYSFSYTKFRLRDDNRQDHGFVVGGKETVTYIDLLKCCWLCFPTVMYDTEVVGIKQVKNLSDCNDYALWLKVAEKADCHLLNECLTTQSSGRHLYSPFPINNKLKWRYEVYHTELGKNPIVSSLMTVRCLWNGIMKKIKYSEKC
jgi:glycosyltransferase involved in cell wall biosynthesis